MGSLSIIKKKKRGRFWYLSHGLRSPSEGGCGDNTHRASPIISSVKVLVSHLNNTISHLQVRDRKHKSRRENERKTNWATCCFLCNTSNRCTVPNSKPYLTCRFVYHIYCFSSAKSSIWHYSPNLSSALISLQAYLLMLQNVTDSILKPSQGNELACSKKQYLYPPIMWLSAWLTCDSSPMPILDQTRITWATWAIWITDFTPFSVNHPSKDRLTWRSHCSFQFIFLHHCFIVCHRQPLE